MSNPVEITLDQIMAFKQLFSGNDGFYGETTFTGQTREDGKQEVRCVTTTGALLRDHYKAHLEGKLGLGVCPIKSDSTVSFGAIDVDSYGEGTKELAKRVSNSGLPLCPCSSKSGGLHIFVFFANGTRAKDAVDVLNKVRLLLGLPNKTEIFPKQTKLTNKGNWINLPYFNAGKGNRLLWQAGEQVTSLSQALTTFNEAVRSVKQWKEIFDGMELDDAPPCLQALYHISDLNNRNTYLFNLATYYKAKGGDWKEEVLEANNQLPVPLSEEEIERTVFNSHDHSTYAYQCSQSPLCDRCDKALCNSRKYGCASKDLPDIDYGQMTMVMSRPPTYYWEINGKRFQFENAGALRKYSVFQEQCADQLGFFPHTMKQDKWFDILNLALKNVIKTEAQAEERSADYVMRDTIKKILMQCHFDGNERTVLFGGETFFDVYTKEVVFKFEDLFANMNDGRVVPWSSASVVEWLLSCDAKTDNDVPNARKRAVWRVPAENVASKEEWSYALTERQTKQVHVDFSMIKAWVGDELWNNDLQKWQEVSNTRVNRIMSRAQSAVQGESDI